jgi:hypothetical protein
MALRSTHPLTEMGNRNIYWGVTLPPSCIKYLEIWAPQPPGTLWACNSPLQGLIYLYVDIYIDKTYDPTDFFLSFFLSFIV